MGRAIGFTRRRGDEQLTMSENSGTRRTEGFCCKRGHFAILPLTPNPPRACSARCATDALDPSSPIWPASVGESE
jgi:hypothetical protein